MKRWIMVLLLAASCAVKHSQESVSGSNLSYRQVCERAAADPVCFQNFRSNADFCRIVEIGNGHVYVDYLRSTASKKILYKMKRFEKLERIGSPLAIFALRGVKLSATTLRYIAIAAHIETLFSLPTEPRIAEIGSGFGGQCFILSQLYSFSDYYIFDLPEVESLIEKVLAVLNVKHATFNNCKELDSVDLIISNYAFSECARKTQLEYFDRVIKKAKRGYITYNQIAQNHGIDYLSPDEFIALLKQHGKHPKICKEPVQTDVNNLVIIWGESEI